MLFKNRLGSLGMNSADFIIASPDNFKKSKQIFRIEFVKFLYKSILLIKLSQTAYFDGLTLPDCRKWYCDSTGLNITL